MMTLKSMREVVETLDADNTSPIADDMLSRWEHDPGTARFFRASANFLFTFKRSGKPYFLRFNHARERTAEQVHAELDFIHHLASRNIHLAQPRRSLAGRHVESVRTPHGEYHAVVFEALRGEQLELAELTPRMVTRWGRALGALHNASQGYDKPGRPSWQDHLGTVAENLSDEEQVAKRALNMVTERLNQLPTSEDTYGLIHYDFEPDNLIWQTEGVGIVDFDDSARYWFAADIAFALRDLFGDHPSGVNLNHETFRAFVSGYREVRGVSEEELKRIPLFLSAHNLILFAKLRRTLAPNPQDDEPTWLASLRTKLVGKVQSYREGFSALRL